jgi:hypothetical protein
VTLPAGLGLCMPPAVCGNGLVEFGEECEPPNTATCNATCQGLGTLPVGDPCTSATQCAGNFCIAEWPAGYCTLYDCDLDAPDTSCAAAGGDAMCFDIGEWGNPFGVCLDRCDPAGTECRAGYHCLDLGGNEGVCLPIPVCGNGTIEPGEECEPPGTATCSATCQGLGAAPIGAPCTNATECAGNFCIGAWPDGYCSQLGCDLDTATTSCTPYGGDGLCVDVGGAGAPIGMCLDRCNALNPDCRAEYDCVLVSFIFGVCMPDPVCGNGIVERGEECEPPNTPTCSATCQGGGTLPTGSPCTSATECIGNYCFSEANGWPGGYCSQLDCNPFASDTSCDAYGPDAVCGVLDLFGATRVVCLEGCQNDNDCRQGYTCQWAGLTRGCVPP